MHWRTDHRLMQKQLAYANQAYAGTLITLKKVDARFAEIEKLLYL